MITIIPEFVETYQHMVATGKEYAKDIDLGIVGLCRNVADRLDQNINKIDTEIAQYFKSVSYFIYENDSTDNTSDILKSKSKKMKNFKYKSEKLGRQQYGPVKDFTRTQRLAEYRNLCLEHIRQKFKKQTYILVIDLDFASLHTEGIVNSFGWFKHNEFMDGMAGFNYEYKPVQSAYPELWNYDCWAFRLNHWTDTATVPTQPPRNNMLWFSVWNPLIGSPPINVYSAFGGSCIYKKDKMLEAEYSGDNDCEHVLFHKSLMAKNTGFKLFVNPSQVMMVDTHQ